jgi:hypothetical protein
MNILFHANQLGIRGAEVALYDYAYFNRTLLGNESVIAYDTRAKDNRADVIAKFASQFSLLPYADFKELESAAERAGCERAYFIKMGLRDGKITVRLPSLVHAVFPTPIAEVHGTVFAFISEWLSRVISGGRVQFVPHMIHLPETAGDLRDELNIPRDTFVIASYGGAESFDVPFVRGAVAKALEKRRDLVFLAMNYPRLIGHPRAFFLPGNPDLAFKARFIATADAMLHARRLGESFGLACGEFSIRNRPVITFSGSPHRAHLAILGDAALLYGNERALLDILMGIDRRFVAGRNWDRYSEKYSPQVVMETFRRVFLRPLVSAVSS